MNPGLSMVVGPPGTGKTDVAVQIITSLYHNFPDQARRQWTVLRLLVGRVVPNAFAPRHMVYAVLQHTLVITHSNQGLNQIFEKIIHLDVDERHCLRLGHGEEALATDKVR